MKGYVDDQNRPILKMEIGAKAASIEHDIEASIDTAFDGHFVLPIGQIETLGLEALAETEAILADGNKIVLQTYVCYLRWFGKFVAAQVVANDGRFPLFGTALRNDRLTGERDQSPGGDETLSIWKRPTSPLVFIV